MIKDILILDNDIKSSINLNLDYKDKSKINSYIVTSKSIEIINEIVNTFKDSNKNKAKILIGPYGKGKSHLALYMLNLISNKRCIKEYTTLLRKSRESGEYVYESINSFIESEDKYLPVILNSTPYNKSFADILIFSLKNALVNNGLNDLSLDFYFEKAVQKIQVWKKQYELTFKQFEELVGEDISLFIEKLETYDINTYNKFKEIYKQLTAGEEFKPYMDIDPIKIYSETSKKLREKGYKGIFILYDEFSKYIEYLVSQNSVLDIKLLQDFAEFCNRTEENSQVLMMLISHKSIGQYTSNGDKNSIDNWKAIEGRFDEIHYNDFSNQQYEIISSAIKKDESKWNEYILNNEDYFINLIDNFDLRRLFRGLSDKEYKHWIVEGSYPLHPLTTYCLPRISEKVAQNERTLFTFLCKNENNTLSDYITNHNKEVKLDAIFDFFEDSIESLGQENEIYRILKRANRVLQSIDEEIEISIIKSIAIIHMINNFSLIKPNKSIIRNLYGIEGEETLQKLIKENHLIYRKLNDVIDISNDNDIEIFNEIKNAKENNSNIDINNFLNDTFNNIFIESKRHNDINNIIRYFKVKFLGNNVDENYIEQDIKNEGLDGIIYITENPVKVDDKLDVIFVKNNIDLKKLEIIKDLYAIKKIKSSKSIDSSIKIELESLEAQYENNIEGYINEILHMKFNSEIHYRNEKKVIRSKNELSKIVSQIMDERYYRTPIINNEMINKTYPSTVVLTARTKIINQILEYNENKKIIFRKGSLEATLIRSILKMNNAMTQLNDETYLLDYNILNNSPSNGFESAVTKIDKMIKDSINKEIKISEIYDLLMSKKYGFGMKKGVIPVIVAYLFSKYKKYLSIFKDGNEVILDSNALISMDKVPDEYSIMLEEVTHEKEIYLEELEVIFEQYINEKDRKDDNLNHITIGIKRWFLYLSKYARNAKKSYQGNGEYKKLPKVTVKLKNRLRVLNETSIRFLFEELISIFEVNSYSELLVELNKTKSIIDKLTEQLYSNIEKDIKKMFDFNDEVSINNALSNWKDSININALYINNHIGSFLDMIDNHKELNNIEAYLNKLSNCLLGIYISDWNDDTPNIFIERLKNIKLEIEELNIKDEEPKNSLEIVAAKDVELSSRAEMLLEDLKETLDDYSSSVTEEEKQHIIFKLLKHI